MIKMRNSWDDVGMNALRGNDAMSTSQHSTGLTDEKKSRYDFGISTDRSISAPPTSVMGFDVLQGLDKISTWGNDDESYNLRGNLGNTQFNDSLQSESSSFSESNGRKKINFNDIPQGSTLGSTISRPKSAAPQLNPNSCPDRSPIHLFHSQPDAITNSSPNSLLQGFDVMKIGARRSASTGLIGGSQKDPLVPHDMLSNRKPKTFMDLIQEDVPPKDSIATGYKDIPSIAGVSRGSEDVGHSKHVYSSQPGGIHDVTLDVQSSQVNANYANRDDGHRTHINLTDHVSAQAQQVNQNNVHIGGISAPNTHNNLDNQNHFYQQRNHHPMMQHVQQNTYEQVQGVQYYNPHQRDNIPMHTQSPPMHPQVVQNGNINPPLYVNPSYGSYTTVQYHQAPPAQHYGHNMNSMMHSHDPNLNSRLQHPPQFVTAVPIQGGIPGQINAVPSNGTFIYFHQPNTLQRQSHPQPITIVDTNGRPATIAVAPNTVQNVGRKYPKQSGASGNRNSDKACRKVRGANGKKHSSGSSLDASRHSLSSGTLSLLEEYRSSKDRPWSAHDVKGHIVEFCQDQNGSRFVQQRLEVANDAEMAVITSEILPSLHLLRNDVFGNYVVQKLFEHGNHGIRSTLKDGLQSEITNLSSQMYGCRVVQKAIEKVDDDDLIDLLSEFHHSALSCIRDQNGNHVIQKIIQVVSSRSKTFQAENKEKAIEFSKQLRFILDCVIENIVALSCHPFGCRVLQRILEHCVESQKSEALDCIQKCLRTLLDDQYGNYVIQHVLQFGRKSDRDVVLRIVVENGILGLSRQKFASNVIEKLLKYGNGGHRNEIVRQMLKPVNDITVENGHCSIALLMVRDAYANYVVQTTLDVAPEGEEKELLIQELRNNSSQLRNYTFAKHIITKLEEGDTDIRRLG